MKGIGIDKVNRFRMKKQHLTDKSKIDDIVKIVNNIGGLHATSPVSMYISLFTRMNNFKKEDLNQQLYTLKNLGKIRFVRGTMYALSKEMIPLAYSATKGIFSTLQKKYADLAGMTGWRKVLSNFYMAPFALDGYGWNSVEHYYQGEESYTG